MRQTQIPEQRRVYAIHAVRRVSVVAACTALFALLAVALIYAGPSAPWDVTISAFVQSMRSPAADATMITATYLCSWQVVVSGGILATIYFLILNMRFAVAAMVLSLLGNVLIVSSIKNILHRVRPDQVHALLPASGSTFPSGHTFSAFAFYGLLALIYVGQGRRALHKWLVIALTGVLIALVGLSRIYVGAHWPSDVLGSIFLGSGWIALLGFILGAAREQAPMPSSAVANPRAGNWAVLIVLLWAMFIVAYAFVFSPATPSAAIA